MSSNVTRLPPGVAFRICPECSYMVTQEEAVLIKFNLVCPRCKKHKLDEFQPIKAAP